VRIPRGPGPSIEVKEHDVTKKLRMLVVAGVVAAMAVGGGAVAGAQRGHASKGRKQTLHVSADAHGKLQFHPNRLSARAGSVTIVMSNPKSSGMMHSVAVEGHGVDKDGKTVKPGGTSRVTATLKKGSYEFYCPFDGHKQAGMTGTVTVR
jgi:uncharacterized cupredoxin-like copper-binding protein